MNVFCCRNAGNMTVAGRLRGS